MRPIAAILLALPRLFVRVSRLENKMNDVQNDIDTIAKAESALEAHVSEQDAEIQALKSATPVGTVITDDLASQIHALAEKSSAAVASFTPAAPTATDPLAITPNPTADPIATTTPDPAFGA